MQLSRSVAVIEAAAIVERERVSTIVWLETITTATIVRVVMEGRKQPLQPLHSKAHHLARLVSPLSFFLFYLSLFFFLSLIQNGQRVRVTLERLALLSINFERALKLEQMSQQLDANNTYTSFSSSSS